MLTPEQALALIDKEDLSLIPNRPWMVEKDTGNGILTMYGQTPLDAVNNWYKAAKKQGVVK